MELRLSFTNPPILGNLNYLNSPATMLCYIDWLCRTHFSLLVHVYHHWKVSFGCSNALNQHGHIHRSWANICDIWIKMQNFAYKKMHLKMSSVNSILMHFLDALLWGAIVVLHVHVPVFVKPILWWWCIVWECKNNKEICSIVQIIYSGNHNIYMCNMSTSMYHWKYSRCNKNTPVHKNDCQGKLS